MCSISGFFGTRKIAPDTIRECLTRMGRRGPDASSFIEIPLSREGFCYLLHSRLSILDLHERAGQPMLRGNTIVATNSEVYNYLELTNDLLGKEYSFITQCDTEVLVSAIDDKGSNAFRDFNGMYAIASFNYDRQLLTVARDSFGELPLYLLRSPEGVYFSSEVECLWILSGQKPAVNTPHLQRYLVHGYKSLYKELHDSFFHNVLPLPRNTVLELKLDGHNQLQSNQISHPWQPKWHQNSSREMSYEEAVRGVKERLIRSMELRLRADVPIAFCLSAGIDSTSLMSIAQRIHRYPVHGFHAWVNDERYLEKEETERFVKELNIHSTFLEIKPEKTLTRMREIVKWRSAPIMTLTFWAHHLLMQQVREEGFKVVISGTAADEIFCGYFDHPLWQIAELWKMMEGRTANEKADEWLSTYGRFVRNPLLKNPYTFAENPQLRDYIYLDWEEFASYLTAPFQEPFEEVQYADNLLRNRNLNELFEETTPVILHEDNIGASYWGLENRSPYLDTDLVEFALSIPTEYLIRNGLGKAVLRDAMRGIVPDWVLDNPRKIGWNLGVESVLDLRYYPLRNEILEPSPIWSLVNRDKFANLLINDNAVHDNAKSKFIWSVVQAKLFLEECR